jgi:uncharacterized membrane protein
MKNKMDFHLLVLLILLIFYAAYWIYFANYKYVNYSSNYYDLGVQAYSLYWHANGLEYYTNPLQYLVFANHLSFTEMLLVLPFFAIYQQPISFLVVQQVTLAITALAIYLIVLDLLKSRNIAFAFAIAFMLSPGAMGLANFDFHMEAFTILFYVLTFYFYLKKRKGYFALSFVLLLGTMEVEPLQGISLLVGLLLYELLHNRGFKRVDKQRLQLLGIGMLLSVLFFAVYYLLFSYIPMTYSNSTVQPIVPIQQPRNYLSEQVNAVLGTGGQGSKNFELLGGLEVLMFFLSFSLSSLVVPLVSTVLFSPWWVEVFVMHNFTFTWPYFQYFSYEFAASVVSAILGLMLVKEGRLRIFGKRILWSSQIEVFVSVLTVITAIIMILFLASAGNPYTLLLNFAPKTNYTALNYAVSQIPASANVLAQGAISSHLFYVRNLELSTSETPSWFRPVNRTVYWFEPDYIIVNKNLTDYSYVVNALPFNESNFSTRYEVIFNESNTYIYKKMHNV